MDRARWSLGLGPKGVLSLQFARGGGQGDEGRAEGRGWKVSDTRRASKETPFSSSRYWC